MSIINCQLRDVVELAYGKSLPERNRKEGTVPVYGSGGIGGYHSVPLVEGPGVIVGRKGTVGSVYFEKHDFFPIDTVYFVRPFIEKISLEYSYYLLKNLPLASLNSDAAVPGLNRDRAYSLPIRLPSLDQQSRIVDFLRQYDDLIENNRRRIQLLEESARLLYQEWFIHLRFPGHEQVKITDGVPEGWEMKPISSLGRVITGKTPSTKNAAYYGDDVPFIKTPDMHGNVFVVSTSQSLSESGSKSQQSTLLPSGCIMVSCIGTVGVVSINPVEAHTNQQINSVIPENKHFLEFLFCGLKKIKPMLEAIGASSTMNNVNKSKFSSIEILVPSERLITEFHFAVASTFELILSFQKQNLALAKARDLLLPKLMNGELAV